MFKIETRALVCVLAIQIGVLANPVAQQCVATPFGNVTIQVDPTNPNVIIANVPGAKNAAGQVVGKSISMTLVKSGTKAIGTVRAYCALANANKFTYCTPNGQTFLHYGPWYYFRNTSPSADVAQWVTKHQGGPGTPPPVPYPDGAPAGGGGGAAPWWGGDILKLGIGDRGLIDSPGINLPCPPLANAVDKNKTLKQKFVTFMGSGIPKKVFASFKWGHTITYNEKTKVTAINSCPVTLQWAGSAEFKACLKKINLAAPGHGYDPYLATE